jgi:HK97 family phage major capsid protein
MTVPTIDEARQLVEELRDEAPNFFDQPADHGWPIMRIDDPRFVRMEHDLNAFLAHVGEKHDRGDGLLASEQRALDRAVKVSEVIDGAKDEANRLRITMLEERAAAKENYRAEQERAARAVGPVNHRGSANATSAVRGQALRNVETRSGLPDSWVNAAFEAVEHDETDLIAQRAAVTADPAYLRAFGKWIRSPQDGWMEWTNDERTAWGRVQTFTRAMSVGTNSAGGYAVPFTLDPSIIITGAGSINPIRNLARVVQTPTDAWHGVTANQVSASWDAEATAVSDDTPTLTQPAIPVYLGRAFIPVSFEAYQDISNLVSKVGKLFADAKDNLEATAFVTGEGSAKPTGIAYAVGAVTASRVSATTAGTLGLADVYATQNAINPRHSRMAKWIANLTVLNKIPLRRNHDRK